MPSALINVTSKPKNKKIVFDDDGGIAAETKTENVKKAKKSKQAQDVNSLPATTVNQKIIFDDNGEIKNESDEDENDYFSKREKLRQKQQQSGRDDDNQKKWFNVFPQYPTSDEPLDMKESEQMELYNLCKAAFEAETPIYNKRNPSDARWLQTALHKGTAKDRANAGALLVTSNPLGNLEALSSLIGFTKISNKSSSDVISTLTDLWKEVLLPPHRKLLSLQLRGADWKQLRKETTCSKEQQRRVFAYWYYENELKDQYFEFLKNLQQGIQTGQEHNKNASIVAASQLLALAPEKEQMLLTMLINKLGDPIAKIASKALHHLTEVAHRHPNMCGVIVTEAEKLLFRNNISDRAQHFTLCFLASIAPAGHADVCTKLVNICFALFKVLVQKGAVNNRTMQAILRCLQKAILDAKPADGSAEILNKEMQDTIYRLVHLADVRVSVQTLGLLLQLVTVKTEKSDRFYNALYIKLLDMNLINIGVKTAAQLLHILHRAIHIDSNIARAQAFIKRLLQVSLYMPPHMTAGCLIVIHKLLRNRRELMNNIKVSSVTDENTTPADIVLPKVSATDSELDKFDSDGEDQYKDVSLNDMQNIDVNDNAETEEKPTIQGSWHHAKVTGVESKVREISASKYDPYHRVPTFAGAELALRNELLLLREHYHPTVQVFADNILNQKRINYYGDPLRDFGLPHFLERFAFKNPKKLDNQKAEEPTLAHKRYVAYGARGKSVKSLTKSNCTEDEMFIFNFLEHKRKQAALVEQVKKSKKPEVKANADEDNGNDNLQPEEVDDNEFEEYLDGFFGKNAMAAAEGENSDEEFDFMQELGGELQAEKNKKKNKKKKKAAIDSDDDIDDIDADWGDDKEDAEDAENSDAESNDMSEDEVGSVDLNNDDDEILDSDMSDSGSIDMNDDDSEDDDDNADVISNSKNSDTDSDEDETAPPKSKKSRKQSHGLSEQNFNTKLKHSDDMSSLFAAADDFAELLEETGKMKGQGTTNALFNKDKSSDKQLKWEEKRRSNTKKHNSKFSAGKRFGAKKFNHKRKN